MRHAQRHFLKVQAEAAVNEAMTRDHDLISREVDDHVEFCKRHFGRNPEAVAQAISIARRAAIADAAKKLLRAELLHRAALRAEGKE